MSKFPELKAKPWAVDYIGLEALGLASPRSAQLLEAQVSWEHTARPKSPDGPCRVFLCPSEGVLVETQPVNLHPKRNPGGAPGPAPSSSSPPFFSATLLFFFSSFCLIMGVAGRPMQTFIASLWYCYHGNWGGGFGPCISTKTYPPFQLKMATLACGRRFCSRAISITVLKIQKKKGNKKKINKDVLIGPLVRIFAARWHKDGEEAHTFLIA